jgi:hypothetical protein
MGQKRDVTLQVVHERKGTRLKAQIRQPLWTCLFEIDNKAQRHADSAQHQHPHS